MAAVDTDRVKNMLGMGLSLDVVAGAVGCTPSYISQLMADQTFADAVATLRVQQLTAHTARDTRIDEVEDKLLAKLSDIADNPAFFKPKDLLLAFRIVNGAKRRGVRAAVTAAPTTQIVNLTIPTVVMQKLTIAGTGEVVEIEGKTMVTMPPDQLLTTLQSEVEDAKIAAAYKDFAKRVAPVAPSVRINEHRTVIFGDSGGNSAELQEGDF